MHIVFALLLAVLISGPAHAATSQGDVSHQGGRYTIDITAQLNAPYKKVRAVIADYAHLTRVSPSMLESTVISKNPLVVRTRTRDCVFFFCSDVIDTQTITEPELGHIISVTDPTQSDLSYGRAEWRITPDGDKTNIILHAEIVPAFWVPPLIGTYLVRARMQQETLQSLDLVEEAALLR